MRLMRSQILEIRTPITSAPRAQRVAERTVMYKHVLRNALNPFVTMAGYSLADLLGGAALVEAVMNLQGLGLAAAQRCALARRAVGDGLGSDGYGAVAGRQLARGYRAGRGRSACRFLDAGGSNERAAPALPIRRGNRGRRRSGGTQWRTAPQLCAENGGWRHGQRRSRSFLLIFYLFAAASPVIAPYNPARQYRDLPDCPPMRLHFSPPAEWDHGFLFAYPMKLADPLARTFIEDAAAETYIRFFHRGHLFTTESPSEPYFILGSEGLGRDLFSRIVYGARVSMCIGLVGVFISFLARYRRRSIFRADGRHDRQLDHALVRNRNVTAAHSIFCSRWRR